MLVAAQLLQLDLEVRALSTTDGVCVCVRGGGGGWACLGLLFHGAWV